MRPSKALFKAFCGLIRPYEALCGQGNAPRASAGVLRHRGVAALPDRVDGLRRLLLDRICVIDEEARPGDERRGDEPEQPAHEGREHARVCAFARLRVGNPEASKRETQTRVHFGNWHG